MAARALDARRGRGASRQRRAASRNAPPPRREGGGFPRDRSFFGVFEMAGNLTEWCLDEYDATYYAWAPDRDPYGPPDFGVKVRRGGAWNHPDAPGIAVRRGRAAANQSYTGFGFRVVREPAP